MEISHKAVMVCKSLNYLATNYLSSKFILHSDIFNSYKLRDSENKLAVPLPKTNNTIEIASATVGAVLWNNLPSNAREAKCLTSFWKLLTSSSSTSLKENRPYFNRLIHFIYLFISTFIIVSSILILIQ